MIGVSCAAASVSMGDDTVACLSGTMLDTADLVASVLRKITTYLEHDEGLLLTDTAFHHCWSFPSLDQCWDLGPDSVAFSKDKSCNCGRFRVSCIPPGSSWRQIEHHNDTVQIIPDRIAELLNSSSKRDRRIATFPMICDPILPKIAAISVSSDLASFLLRTAACVSS